jgi:hypothetical protein
MCVLTSFCHNNAEVVGNKYFLLFTVYRESLVSDIPAEEGKNNNLFYSVGFPVLGGTVKEACTVKKG